MAVLTPQPKMQFTTAAGVPLSGGKVYTYTAGTTTPQATFTDYTGATPNTNPVILDSRGEANIWLGSALYKFKLTDANDVEIWTVDYISAPTSAVSPVLSGSVTIDSDTPSPALKITQTGTGPVLRVQDSADPDATPFIIDTNGNVGLGTTTPAASGVSPFLAIGADNAGIGSVSANNIVLVTSNIERLRVNASGNVGIGTASPLARLQTDSSSTTYSANIRARNSNFGSGVIGAASNLLTVATDMNNMAFYTVSDLGVDGTSAPTNERMRLDSTGNLLFNSGYGSVATAYGCRAWVNWNGTGTVAIRASGNVSSITDRGVGTYTVNLTTAMPDINFAVFIGHGANSPQSPSAWYGASTTSTIEVDITENNGTYADQSRMSVAIFR